MVADALQSVDAEEYPRSEDEHCPRCDATLHDIEPHPDALACPECPFRADLSDFSDQGRGHRLLQTAVRLCWPETRPVGIVLGLVGVALLVWADSFIPGVASIGIGAFLWGYEPSTFCPSCGYSVGDTEGYCANCGDEISVVDALVEDHDADDLLTRCWHAVDDRTPNGVTIDLPNVEFETRRLGWLDRLVVGDRAHWRRLFDGGIVVMALSQLVVLAFAGWVLWTAVTTPNGTAASSSSALPTPTLAWIIPAAAIVAAMIATVIVHELGHGLAAVTDGYSVEEVGLMLTFGVPMMGWMRNEEDGAEAPRHRLRIVSAGILFNLLTGVVGVTALHAIGPTTPAWNDPALLCLQSFTVISLASVPTNAVPLFGSDGDHFLSTAWEIVSEWRAPDPPSVPERSLGISHRLAEGYDA